jgi:glycosyltransferase involved in cell wall biosynthesis
MMRPALTCCIPTLNEALHIERAIASVIDLGPVFVIDCGSEDNTVALAKAAGATVVEHAWQGYAAQKNWALDNLPIETDWILFLDADESLTPALRSEIEEALRDSQFDGFYVARRHIFLKRVLRHAWWYPDYQLRLFKKGRARFESRLVHEHAALNGQAGFLTEPLMHESLKGIEEFIDRHKRYAVLEAQEVYQARRGRRAEIKGKFFGTWPERRRWLKLWVWYRIPWHPAIRFFWLYFGRRGFLDGREGLIYCQLMAASEAMIDGLVLELDLAEKRERAARAQGTDAVAVRN